jgi:hypothetical protein
MPSNASNAGRPVTRRLGKPSAAWQWKPTGGYVLPGGAWLNHGFTTGESMHLADWQVCLDTARIIYKPTAA